MSCSSHRTLKWKTSGPPKGHTGKMQRLLTWLSGKESACQCRRRRTCEIDPWVEKIPWRKKWQPTPVFLKCPMDRGAWWATVHGVTKSQTRLSDWAQHGTPMHRVYCHPSPPPFWEKEEKYLNFFHACQFYFLIFFLHTFVGWHRLFLLTGPHFLKLEY